MNIEIANRLVQMRKEKGFSQEALAEQLGISRQAVSKWERAESSPDTSNLITLAKLYNISLDELLNTDQDKFESSEPMVEADDLDERVENEAVTRDQSESESAASSDYVNIGTKGIHIKDGEDEVHIGWNGIRIVADGEEAVRIGDGGVFVDGEDYSDYNWKADGISGFIVLCVFMWLGAVHGLWHPAWMLFLAIPIVSSLFHAIRTKNARKFAYPMLAVIVYLGYGFWTEVWHPTWLVFLTIPMYYWVVNWFKTHKEKWDEF
ncbi:MAG: helix-turn-helix transcriptional regulator [Turicibacter sp.]|nr:helix-turn-helix transcriptional regulator [Turicibacter sp.]